MIETTSACVAPDAYQGMRSQLFTLYVAAAMQSGHLRVCRAIYRDTPAGVGQSGHYREVDATRKALARLANFCRESGIDPQLHSLFPMLELRTFLLETYEDGRCFETTILSPALIYKAGEKGWRIHYNGWTICRTERTEMDDHYGQPTFGHRLQLTAPDGAVHLYEMPALLVQRARDAYKQITGHSYHANDGLGQDPEHPAERCA